MSITEDELVDSYGTGNAKERFDLIYENYSVFPQLVDCFEIGLFNTTEGVFSDILYQVPDRKCIVPTT